MKRTSVLVLSFVLCLSAGAAEKRARNVILFLGDAGGIPTLNAASAYLHGAPQKLFIQKMPYTGLSDTSPVGDWVSDSAAGMTAIVTGQKTRNGVISQSADVVRGQKDGAPLKTILEYAEEKGLSTGVISNMSMADATPAACYAHDNDRGHAGPIFTQILKPRFGDGVDLVLGAGRKGIYAAAEKIGVQLDSALKEKGYEVASKPEELPAELKRMVALFDTGDYEPWPVVEKAIKSLAKNRKGYFLMVEWDMHTDRPKRGLDRVGQMDEMIRKAVELAGKDTLILFTADHSFDLRLRGGKQGEALVSEMPSLNPLAKTPIRVDNGHTGEEVLVAATGPGAERVRGFMPNTQVFQIMMAAYGWKETK